MVVSTSAPSLLSWTDFQEIVGYPPEAQGETEAQLTAATVQIESYCGRTLREAVHEETMDGHGDGVLILRQWPVRDVETLWVDDERMFGEETEIDGGVFTHDAGCVYLLPGLIFPRQPGIVRVRYRAGFLPEGVPEDVRIACLELVMWRRQRIRTRQVGVVDVVSLIRGSGKTTFEGDLPSSVRELLSPYVRRY